MYNHVIPVPYVLEHENYIYITWYLYLSYYYTRTKCISRDTCTLRSRTSHTETQDTPHDRDWSFLSFFGCQNKPAKLPWHHNFQLSIWSWSKIVQSPCKLAVREWLNKCVYCFWTRVCIKVPGQLNRTKPNGQGLTPLPLVCSLNGAWLRYNWHFFKWFY